MAIRICVQLCALDSFGLPIARCHLLIALQVFLVGGSCEFSACWVFTNSPEKETSAGYIPTILLTTVSFANFLVGSVRIPKWFSCTPPVPQNLCNWAVSNFSSVRYPAATCRGSDRWCDCIDPWTGVVVVNETKKKEVLSLRPVVRR